MSRSQGGMTEAPETTPTVSQRPLGSVRVPVLPSLGSGQGSLVLPGDNLSLHLAPLCSSQSEKMPYSKGLTNLRERLMGANTGLETRTLTLQLEPSSPVSSLKSNVANIYKLHCYVSDLFLSSQRLQKI